MQVRQRIYSGHLITTTYHDELLDTKKYKITPELLYETTVGELLPGFDEEVYIDLVEPVNHLTRWNKTFEGAMLDNDSLLDEVDELIDRQTFPYIKLRTKKHYVIYPDEKGFFQVWQIYTKDDDGGSCPVQLIRVRAQDDDGIDVCLGMVNMLNERERKAPKPKED